ncbi:MAG TPA: hypothetical protein VJ953_20255 [Saprospiraceae bacterium]|nr:hypothetical protein [Saprospiraceae bacterium]
MAKKRFKEGMESLFEENPDSQELEQERKAAAQKPRKEQTDKKTSGKGFRSELKSFLQEAFEESLEEQLDRKDKKRPAARKKSAKPKAGLDALLRSTIEPSKMRLQNKPVRRLTISFDEEKLAKLKKIARKERTYLKDIIDEIVGEFLESYDE